MRKSWIIFVMCLTPYIMAAETQVNIGLLLDGSSEQLLNELPQMKTEIMTLLERDYQVKFSKQLDGAWQLDQIKSHLTALVNDPEIDLVLCIGVLSCMEAATQGPFPKPVFAPYGISSDLPVYPQKNGVSGVKNFYYLVRPGRVARDLEVIRKMVPHKTLHLLADSLIAASVPNIQSWVRAQFAKQGFETEFVLVGDNAEDVLKQLKGDEVVYVTPLVRFSEAEKIKLFDGLRKKRMISFSFLGKEDVRLGVLGGLSPESDQLRGLRRIALNIQRVLSGEDPGSLPILLKNEHKLTFNMEVARDIGWYPDWSLQISAQLINQDKKKISRKLTLVEAVREALAKNLDIKVNQIDVETQKHLLQEVKSQKKPQIESSLTGVLVDADLAEASFGQQAERTVSANLTMTQVLFSEELNAGTDIRKKLVDASTSELKIKILDITQETANRYLNYLKAKALTKIRRDNLSLTESHLETARNRREIGISGLSELYRWESQVALDKQDAIAAQNQEDSALAALNQILNYTQESPVQLEVPSLYDSTMLTGRGRLGPFVRNARDFQLFRGFMVALGLKQAPELSLIDNYIDMRTREVVSHRRSYYMPTVALKGEVDHLASRSGAGVDSALSIPGVAFPEREDTSWNVALNFSIPLYKGGARKASLGVARSQVEGLRQERQAVAEKIELRIRASAQKVAAASVAIDLSQISSKAAHENYDLIKDAYAKGVATAIDLLDAQNAALVAEQAAANALYDFLIETAEFQRATGRFVFLMDENERDQFFESLDAFYKQAK